MSKLPKGWGGIKNPALISPSVTLVTPCPGILAFDIFLLIDSPINQHLM